MVAIRDAANSPAPGQHDLIFFSNEIGSGTAGFASKPALVSRLTCAMKIWAAEKVFLPVITISFDCGLPDSNLLSASSSGGSISA